MNLEKEIKEFKMKIKILHIKMSKDDETCHKQIQLLGLKLTKCKNDKASVEEKCQMENITESRSKGSKSMNHKKKFKKSVFIGWGKGS